MYCSVLSGKLAASMMNTDYIKELLQQGEGYNLEYKEGYAEDVASEIRAFANAAGGTSRIRPSIRIEVVDKVVDKSTISST